MNEESTGVVQRLIRFLREVWIELQKVAWPSWEELKGSTGVVIVAVILISVFIGVVDAGLLRLVRLVLR
ncbi:MAG: preprotein translocase subunit SecE [Candidatus Eisenbacteria bacterium]|nr:preprotein translocase subunit SecE [Candidatus Eisenbacteria bacterium]